MVSIIYLEPGQDPPQNEEHWMLMEPVHDGDTPGLIKHKRGVTYKVAAEFFLLQIAEFRDRAEESGYTKLYVRRPPDR